MFQYGRINRSTYWFGLALIAAIYITINLLATKRVGVAEFVIAIVAVPRLHDIGRTGWWAGATFLAEVVTAVVALVFLPKEIAMMMLGFFVLALAGLLIWLGTIKGDPVKNRFGDPPASGLLGLRISDR